MINVEQFMSSSGLVSLNDRQIESICDMNRWGDCHDKTYILWTGENNMKLAAFAMKHLNNTDRSCDPASVYKPYVMSFKEQQRARTWIQDHRNGQ